jgi:translation initiation factor IF-3
MFAPQVNRKIKAADVRVVSKDQSEVGVFPIADAWSLAASRGLDLIETEPHAIPPICLMMNLGMYRYRISKQKSHES